jgi:hypothetical protein
MIRNRAAAVFFSLCVAGHAFATPVPVPGTPALPGANVLPQAGAPGSTQLPQTETSQIVKPTVTNLSAATTYHYDTLRTGWDWKELYLTTANVSQVVLQHVAFVSGQVDAEPLFVSAVNLGANGVHDLVYVVTENNWVYAVDAESGKIILQRNLGTPVPQSAIPDQCTNNSASVGIQSTPVINTSNGNIYVMAYTYQNNVPTYTLHSMGLGTLNDTVPPQNVAAIGRLANGASYTFNAAVTRQRPALLLSQGVIYAGFGSFCDSASRGWVLGWYDYNLAPLGAEVLNNENAVAQDNVFLTSIWMAGFGLAADANGSIYFATSNSDPSGTSWNATTNLEESVVKMSGTLGSVQSYYTPNNASWGQKPADAVDGDLGAGGVMLLPTQKGSTPNLAVAGGKISGALLLNRDNLGGYGNNQLDVENAGGCWCGPSYFADSSGVGHVVISAGDHVTIYTVQTSPSPKLIKPIVSPEIETGQDPGFFTTVSSNGTTPGSTIIWAMDRPLDDYPGEIYLRAFDPNTGKILMAIGAGIWRSPEADANLVPTVANGHIFVGSLNQVAIFGLPTPGAKTVEIPVPPPAEEAALPAATPHQISGTVVASQDGSFTLQTRTGATIEVDTSAATHFGAARQPAGTPVLVRGNYTSGGFKAVHILHLKPQLGLWPTDR